MKNVVTVLTLSLLLGACATGQKNAASNTTAPADANSQAQASAASQAATQQQAALDALEKQSIFFDFDKSDVKANFRAVAQQEADWMHAHNNDTLTLQGNTDDRGSNEYNLALGSRRAKAVHQALVAMGVPSSRIKDVSLGETKPRATCEEEKCWQENRRVDFVHQMN